MRIDNDKQMFYNGDIIKEKKKSIGKFNKIEMDILDILSYTIIVLLNMHNINTIYCMSFSLVMTIYSVGC